MVVEDMTTEERKAAFAKDWEASGDWPGESDFPHGTFSGINPGTIHLPTETVMQGFKMFIADVPTTVDNPRGGWPVVRIQIGGVDNPEITDPQTAEYVRKLAGALLDKALEYLEKT